MSNHPTIPGQHDSTLIAPVWHTCILILIACAFSALGAYNSYGHLDLLTRAGVPGSSVRVTRYLVGMSFEWLLVLFVWFGIRPSGLTLRTLIAGRWPTWRAALRDMGIAVIFLIVTYIVIGILSYALRVPRSLDQNPLIQLLPHGGVELAVFSLVALSAGFCEELVFRGYLMQQLSAMTKNRTAGLLLQSLVFGIGHGYQGLTRMAIIAIEGCLLGMLARWRQNLRPGMIAHTLQDAIAGIAMFAMTK